MDKDGNNSDQKKREDNMRMPRGEIKMDATEKRPCTPSQSLAKSLREMNAIRDGKTQGRTWRELRANLKKEK